MWTILAWGVVVVHVAYLSYQMLGGLFALNDRRWLVPHLMAVTWGIGIVVVQGKCPFTSLEKWLHVQAGGTAYDESFLDHYVFGTLLPDGSQALVYGLHLVVIIAVYVVVARHWHRARRPGGPDRESVTTSSGTQ